MTTTMTIELPAELKQALGKIADEQGTTPESLIVETLRERFIENEDLEADRLAPGSLAEFLEGYVGVFDSRDFAPDAPPMSERTGEQFADILVEKQNQGHL